MDLMAWQFDIYLILVGGDANTKVFITGGSLGAKLNESKGRKLYRFDGMTFYRAVHVPGLRMSHIGNEHQGKGRGV